MVDANISPGQSLASEIAAANREYAASYPFAELPGAPARAVAVVACMDCRLPVLSILGLDEGDAHVLRNAGGVVTDDMIRSLMLSQRALGTREIVLVHHTDCGLGKVSEEAFYDQLEDELGERPSWPLEAFDDPAASVRRSIARLQHSPFIAEEARIAGFVYDVESGLLNEVVP